MQPIKATAERLHLQSKRDVGRKRASDLRKTTPKFEKSNSRRSSSSSGSEQSEEMQKQELIRRKSKKEESIKKVSKGKNAAMTITLKSGEKKT